MPANIYKNKAGEAVPGVTTVIGRNLGWGKDALMHWANKMGLEGKNHRDVSGAAADTGTITHKMVELEIQGIKFEWPKLGQDMGANAKQIKQAENAFEGFVDWKQAFKFELLQSEHLLISERYQYGGQLDIAAIQGKRAIIDIKTSNNIYPAHVIQIAAYKNLWDENFPGQPIETCYILRLSKDKDEGFSYHNYRDVSNAFRAFVILRELHDLEKKL